MLRNFIRGEEGQTATETMLVIGVVVTALVGAAVVFYPTFETAVGDMADQVSEMLTGGQIGDRGMDRSGGGGDGGGDGE